MSKKKTSDVSPAHLNSPTVDAPLFQAQIAAAVPSEDELRACRLIYIPYDRFTDRTGPITEQSAAETCLIMVESVAKVHRRPYHKKKLVVLISNMRHFALEQAARGVKVLYHFSPTSHGQALLALQRGRKLGSFTLMQPAERELRLDLASAQSAGLKIDIVPDTTWASETGDFTSVFGAYQAGKSYVMDRFYRRQREKHSIFMENGKPLGGQFSYDADNRNAWKGQPPVPQPPSFPPDAVTNEVISMIETLYPHHFGSIENFNLPCTQSECDRAWQFALTELLPTFGPYEDAMRDDQLQLFHSKTSVLLNLGRLLALDLVRDVERNAHAGLIPLPSAEGFIRQLIGWREFMRHLHEQTDGYRLLAGSVPQQQRTVTQERSPDAAQHRPSLVKAKDFASSRASNFSRSTDPDPYNAVLPQNTPDPYAGATPSALGANLPLPAAYWGVKSGMHCLDTSVAQVIDEGWTHHIPRLMVLSNLATLCGFSPRELTDWFWFGYIDAYDWVVETNVLGMATYADGGLTATKPYVSGAAYINKMSNFCGHCQYDPKKSSGEGSCPFTSLYWTFLERNEPILGKNFRMQMPYTTLHKKSAADLVQLRARAQEAIDHLQSFPRPR